MIGAIDRIFEIENGPEAETLPDKGKAAPSRAKRLAEPTLEQKLLLEQKPSPKQHSVPAQKRSPSAQLVPNEVLEGPAAQDNPGEDIQVAGDATDMTSQ